MKMFKGWCLGIFYQEKIKLIYLTIQKAHTLWIFKKNLVIIQTNTIHNISNFEIGIYVIWIGTYYHDWLSRSAHMGERLRSTGHHQSSVHIQG
jgi:hypothetical protein